jgi:hypothetical protein
MVVVRTERRSAKLMYVASLCAYLVGQLSGDSSAIFQGFIWRHQIMLATCRYCTLRYYQARNERRIALAPRHRQHPCIAGKLSEMRSKSIGEQDCGLTWGAMQLLDSFVVSYVAFSLGKSITGQEVVLALLLRSPPLR